MEEILILDSIEYDVLSLSALDDFQMALALDRSFPHTVRPIKVPRIWCLGYTQRDAVYPLLAPIIITLICVFFISANLFSGRLSQNILQTAGGPTQTRASYFNDGRQHTQYNTAKLIVR